MATFATPPATEAFDKVQQSNPGLDSRLGKDAATFAASTHAMLIDGQFTAASSGKTFPVYNPATGDVICHVPRPTTSDVDKAVHAARRAFDSGPWSTISPSARGPAHLASG